MNYYISGRLASLIDSYSINEIGIPSVVLMERAAFAVAEEIIEILSCKKSVQQSDNRILIVCGVGNNGADGLAVARIINLKGFNVRVVISGNIAKSSEEFKLQYEIVKKLNIEVQFAEDLEKLNEVFKEKYALIVDGLFGIGLSRDIEGLKYDLINLINKTDIYVLAIDIPSGIDSNIGIIKKIAVKADKTITFGYPKAGHIIGEGKKYTGKLIVKDIGFFIPDNWDFGKISDINIEDNLFESLTKKELCLIPKRNITSNKSNYKNVIVIGAGENMSGAVALSAESAYRCGCGIVKIYADNNNLNVLKNLIKEAIVNEYDKLNFSKINIDKDIIIIGPGLAVNDKAEQILEQILDVKCKKILDADALNIISRNKILLEKLDENVIITPHIKEMSRLTGIDVSYIKENIVSVAKEFSLKYKCITVIKDSTTVISSNDGIIRINSTGNSGMSKGGSGDVLTGIIAGMISQGMNMFDAASVGVFIHGMAGDFASEKFSGYSMMASDIIKCLPDVFCSIVSAQNK